MALCKLESLVGLLKLSSKDMPFLIEKIIILSWTELQLTREYLTLQILFSLDMDKTI